MSTRHECWRDFHNLCLPKNDGNLKFLVYCDWHKRLAEEESTEFYVCKLSRSRSTRLSVPRDSLLCVLCQRECTKKEPEEKLINSEWRGVEKREKRKKETKEVGNYANALESKICVKITSFEEEFNSTRQDDWALSRAGKIIMRGPGSETCRMMWRRSAADNGRQQQSSR